MILNSFTDNFRLQLPFQRNGEYWNGRVDEFNNIRYGLGFSQRFGDTYFSRTWNKKYNRYPYGGAFGHPNPHNGHDYAGIEGTPICFPIRSFLTYSGYDKGYGNFVFYETETITENGNTFKLEIVNAHLKEPCKLEINRWYDIGVDFGLMGSTGFSTGPHTHFGIRPLIIKNNSTEKLMSSNRGYVDPQLFLDTEPIEDKAKLLKYMRLIKQKDKNNVYAIDKYGKANLIINEDSFRDGIALGLWKDEINIVANIPEKGKIIILANDK